MEELKKLLAVCASYAVAKGLCKKEDYNYVHNRLLSIFDLDAPYEGEVEIPHEIASTLSRITDLAFSLGYLKDNTPTFREIFDNKVASCMLMPPSQVVDTFSIIMHTHGIERATQWFYALCCNSNYIRTMEIARNMQWKADSDYGTVEVTVNLTKPEKDPKEIALAMNAKSVGYPLCQLCPQNVGYAGRVNHPPRALLRTIPITLNGEQWHMQYSPYVYFNEHCIALSEAHVPMEISRATYVRLFDFQDQFPHYFIGSNAGLPIAGGSILGHLHFQGGRYTLPMMTAPLRKSYDYKVDGVEIGVLNWPMPAIRLSGRDRDRLIDAAARITEAWECYSDPELGIFATTQGEKHNTITPILHIESFEYKLDLVLRNNITTEDLPLGVFHPHPTRHHVKKENIGLIEVMGLFILPGRLKSELIENAAQMLAGEPYDAEKVEKHMHWLEQIRQGRSFTDVKSAQLVLKQALGELCIKLLDDAAVFKDDEAGRAGLDAFLDSVFM